jgi:hypothetical protein
MGGMDDMSIENFGRNAGRQLHGSSPQQMGSINKINNLTQSAPQEGNKRQLNQTLDPSFEQKRANRGGSSGMVGTMQPNNNNLERGEMMINSFVQGYQRPMNNNQLMMKEN